jgi:hypothetical protein
MMWDRWEKVMTESVKIEKLNQQLKLVVGFIFVCLLCLAVATPAVAAPPNKEKGPNCSDTIDNDNDGLIDGDDPDCGGSDDGGSTGGNAVFHVSVIAGDEAPWSTGSYPTDCAAYAPADGKSYSAKFPRHLQCVPQCWIPLFNDKFLTDDLVLSVRTRKGRFVGLTITGQDWIGGDGIMHESDQIPLNIPILADISGGFKIPVNKDVTIHRLKGHLGGPRVEVAGEIHIGELMYSPCILGSDCPSTGNSDYPDECLQ